MPWSPAQLCRQLSSRSWLRRSAKDGLPLGVPLRVLLGPLLPCRPVTSVFVGDALLERVVWLGLDEEVPDGLEDGSDLGRGLPVLRLEDGKADVAHGVVGDVGVVDAGDELDHRGFEGVVGR